MNTDANSVDNHTYALVSGEGDFHNNDFEVDGDQIRIQDSPDFENKSSYSIRLQATDNGGLSHTESFTLRVNNLADNSNPQPGTPFPEVAIIFGDEITLRFPDEPSEAIPSKLRFNVSINGQKVNIREINQKA